MIYLCEREIGFDATSIGYPSISGCRAVAALTAGGLFGFHLNGSLSAGKKDRFANFVRTHPRSGPILALYAASTDARNQYYTQELRDIADAVTNGGPIYWADLSKMGARSAYVEMRIVPGNGTCIVTARPWSDPVDGVDNNRGAYVDSASRTIANGAAPSRMYTSVDQGGLKAYYPTRI